MVALYDELRALAAYHLRGERGDHTLQPTALVHEAYLRLADQSRVDWQGRSHFMAMAAEMIRRILVDHARQRLAQKRGGGWQRVTLAPADEGVSREALDVLAVDAALERLSLENPREARVLEMRVFGGLTVERVAEALGVSASTVDRDWRMARAWLSRELRREGSDGER